MALPVPGDSFSINVKVSLWLVDQAEHLHRIMTFIVSSNSHVIFTNKRLSTLCVINIARGFVLVFKILLEGLL